LPLEIPRLNPKLSVMTELLAPNPLEFSDAAANKVRQLITEEANPALKLRVYITGGGCSGFQYGFAFDDQPQDDDLHFERAG
jgi:iron-sulfur cluster insertion protein